MKLNQHKSVQLKNKYFLSEHFISLTSLIFKHGLILLHIEHVQVGLASIIHNSSLEDECKIELSGCQRVIVSCIWGIYSVTSVIYIIYYNLPRMFFFLMIDQAVDITMITSMVVHVILCYNNLLYQYTSSSL